MPDVSFDTREGLHNCFEDAPEATTVLGASIRRMIVVGAVIAFETANG